MVDIGSGSRLTTTLFSGRQFASAVARSFPEAVGVRAIPVSGSGPPRTMYATSRQLRFGARDLALSEFGLYASPGWEGLLEPGTISSVLSELKTASTRRFVWNVRFDHALLADRLLHSGLQCSRASTHALRLDDGYERVFAGYNATIRNSVRRTRKSGLTVDDAHRPDDFQSYQGLYLQAVNQRGTDGFVYPMTFIQNLASLPEARLLVARLNDRVIAGGLFLLDGCSVLYWHGALDRAYANYFPMVAVLDQAICWALRCGATVFNFGASNGIESLEYFKSSWNAHVERNWRFEWYNPLWLRLERIGRQVKRRAV